MPTNSPGLVAAVQSNDGNSCITYKIYARFAEAVKERPIPGKFTLEAERGSDLAAQIEDFAKFGAPLENVPAKDISAGLPGGFATTMPTGLVSLRASGPIPDAVAEVTITVLNPDESIFASLDFITDEITTGQDKTALRTTGHERSAGIVTFELRVSPEDKTQTLQLTLGDVTGKRPSAVLPGLRFVAGIRPPRRLQISICDGPALGRPNAVDGEIISEADGHNTTVACEALAEIQKAVFVRITVPDLAATTTEDLESWLQAAALLRGQQLTGKWHQVKVHLNPGTEPRAGVEAILSRQPWTVKIGDNTYQFGTVDVYALAGHVDETRPPEQHEDHLDVWYVPAGTDAMTLRLAAAGASALAGT